jgi:hypothetical protein
LDGRSVLLFLSIPLHEIAQAYIFVRSNALPVTVIGIPPAAIPSVGEFFVTTDKKMKSDSHVILPATSI